MGVKKIPSEGSSIAYTELSDKQILNPVDGAVETDPLRRYAIENGHWYIDKYGFFRLNWNGIKRAVYPHFQVPRYFGFTPEEREIYYKLVSESFYPLRSVGYLLGLKTPSQGVKFCFDASIPIYRINKIMYVFSGDIVRSIAQSRVDTTDPVVAAVVQRHQARRWDASHWLRKKRDSTLREEGEAPGAKEDASE